MALWTLGRIDLKLSESEFWSLAPWEFFALLERHHQREDLANFRAGLAPAATYNVKRDPNKHPEPIQPLDFFRSEPEQPRIASAEEILQKLQRFGVLARAFDRNTTKG